MERTEKIKIPKGLGVHIDAITGTRTIFFPIPKTPNNVGYGIALLRLKNEEWDYANDIDEIIIKWKKHENRTTT